MEVVIVQRTTSCGSEGGGRARRGIFTGGKIVIEGKCYCSGFSVNRLAR